MCSECFKFKVIRNHSFASGYAILNSALYFEGILMFQEKMGLSDHSAIQRETASDDVMFALSFLSIVLLVVAWDSFYRKNQKWFDNQSNRGFFEGLTCWQSTTKVGGLIGSGVKTVAGFASFFKLAVDAGINPWAAGAMGAYFSGGHFYSSVAVLSDQEAKPKEDASRALLDADALTP